GGANRVIRVSYASLHTSLRADFTSVQTYAALFPQLNGSIVGFFDPEVVTSVTLPNNQQYIFKYNVYGELARVQLPTGGAFEYDFAGGIAGGYTSGVIIGVAGDFGIYRRMIQRRVYAGAAGTPIGI